MVALAAADITHHGCAAQSADDLADIADAIIAESARRDSLMKIAGRPTDDDGWVRCGERMPDSVNIVLVHLRAIDSVLPRCYNRHTAGWTVPYTGDREESQITHWRPLPPPPKAGEA